MVSFSLKIWKNKSYDIEVSSVFTYHCILQSHAKLYNCRS